MEFTKSHCPFFPARMLFPKARLMSPYRAFPRGAPTARVSLSSMDRGREEYLTHFSDRVCYLAHNPQLSSHHILVLFPHSLVL